ncbi:type ISP restriction/modification enzyme [Pontibacter actiniarum]|uniref:site-specific DNA-methyltransferase (adenine-specific) n=1 Tax=Pontibacter actiniarum TaxID=323450 RepID=A0A1X9YUJ6_9BACT|nr:type ISP restriction/modification enzyme [Pontibacter actiniarum]ARS36590.1 DNA methyltransferase [Pontibacter actiniarum]
MTVQDYLDRITTRYNQGISREHSYRGDLQNLLEALAPEVLVTNEPARVACGAPDYIITKKEIPVGYIEAKDIGVPLNSKSLKEQFDRYRASLDNLLITDYLDFHLYIDGDFKTSVKIAELQNGLIKPLQDNFTTFTNLVKDFCTFSGQTIKSSRKLAEMMAGKARMLADVIEKALNSDVENQENSTLKDQMNAFQQVLIHDIKSREFADIYAQTIAYGMFAARLHDPTLPTFTRQEAAELIPKSNPFLRTLFQYIAGYDLDSRIKWIVDGLADLFRATDVAALLKNFGKATQTHDPIIHFYETFLAEYDPKLRKARGVWYTPEPVVNFIVRAVDDILKTEFDLPQGLADTAKTKVSLKIPTHDKRYKAGQREIEQEVHKVQILDPATGTGTFLAEVVKHVYDKFNGQQGIWSNYVENHLVPRLNGFELLMASYAMAHLKLDLLLSETGYKPTRDQRFRVYLTNSLEEHHPDTGSLFATALANEANEANHIKRDTPVMVVIGNPPYSGESANKGEWIMSLMEDYKKEPGGKVKLKEKNSKFINDDYVKFLRYGQHFIERNGEGVLAFINPHGFLDNPTFRGMRWNLLKTYDKVYTIDLHGNAKKKEVAPDGSPDVNVFDIEQGVSINFFIKTGRKQSELGQVFHFDLFGKRETKYSFLLENTLSSTPYNQVYPTSPHFFLSPKNFEDQNQYEKGIYLLDLFHESSLGVLSKNDEVTIDFDKEELRQRINFFTQYNEAEVKKAYNVKDDSRDWALSRAIQDLKDNHKEENYKVISYRPFDCRWTYFTGKPKGFFAYSQNRIMRNMRGGDNFALVSGRQGQAVGSMAWNLSFITDTISDQNIYYRGGGTVFPLYIYPNNTLQVTTEPALLRVPNLNKEIVQNLQEKLSLKFTSEKENTPSTFSPVDILDYIYAVLHSPSYREKYKEFLKIDFPRVPYPTDVEEFRSLVELGSKLRQIHLLESPIVDNYITQYPEDGSNVVEKPKYDNGNVYISDTQYFANVPLVAWEFYIGGYQPAQKWLKDRKGRQLSFDDIMHYQKIIVALNETDRLMQEVDKVGVVEENIKVAATEQ